MPTLLLNANGLIETEVEAVKGIVKVVAVGMAVFISTVAPAKVEAEVAVKTSERVLPGARSMGNTSESDNLAEPASFKVMEEIKTP